MITLRSESPIPVNPPNSVAAFSIEHHSEAPVVPRGLEERNNLNRRRVDKPISHSNSHKTVGFESKVTNLRTGTTEPLRSESYSDLRRRSQSTMEAPWTYNAPPGHRALEACIRGGRGFSLKANRNLVLVLTFICYASYHASRKPPSIVKSVLHGDGETMGMLTGGHRRSLLAMQSAVQEPYSLMTTTNISTAFVGPVYENRQLKTPVNDRTKDQSESLLLGNEVSQQNSKLEGWAPFNNPSTGKSLLGDLDLAFLAFYALGMFVSGLLGDRVDLRYFLTIGMLASGMSVLLFGAAYFWNIHSMTYFVAVQIFGGVVQSSGWPAVVSVMANWFGHGKRGVIMTVWNAHTSIGNIMGSLIAAKMVIYGWGWSFILPGALMIVVGMLIFLFLVVEPQDIGFLPQSGSAIPSQLATPGTPGTGRALSAGPESERERERERERGMMSDAERALLERLVAQLAERHGGRVPAQVAASQQAHHHLHVPHGRHGMFPMGSTLVMVDEHRGSVEGSEDEEGGPEVWAGPGSGARKGRGAVRGGSPSPTQTGGSERSGVSFFSAWCIPGVATYAMTLFFAKLTAYTFLYWLPYYISSTVVGGRALTPSEAGNLSIIFDIGGVLGGILAGKLSDSYGAPALVCCGYVYTAIPVLYLYRAYGAISFTINIALMASAGFLVNGPYALITTAISADLGSGAMAGNEKVLATVTSIIDGMGSIGAALGPMLTGYVSELPGGFDNVFIMLYVASLCAGLLLTGIVLNELGLISKRRSMGATNTTAPGSGDSARGGSNSMDDLERSPLISAADVVNSAGFTYNPPYGAGGGELSDGREGLAELTIDNESGIPTRVPVTVQSKAFIVEEKSTD